MGVGMGSDHQRDLAALGWILTCVVCGTPLAWTGALCPPGGRPLPPCLPGGGLDLLRSGLCLAPQQLRRPWSVAARSTASPGCPLHVTSRRPVAPPSLPHARGALCTHPAKLSQRALPLAERFLTPTRYLRQKSSAACFCTGWVTSWPLQRLCASALRKPKERALPRPATVSARGALGAGL